MKITLITVCFNSEATIADMLESVARQTHPEIEHLIIDGASTDDTLAVINAHRAACSRVISEPDRGIYDAMNKGLRAATGEVIGFLNADDFFADDTVLAQVAAAMADPALDACYADLDYVDQHDTARVVRQWRSTPFVPGSFAHGWCPAHPTFYVRRSVYERLGGFDDPAPLGADVVLMMRLLEVAGISARHVPAVWVKMREGGESNRSLGNIFWQNVEIARAARRMGLPFNPLSFLMKKLANRIGQRRMTRDNRSHTS